MNITTWITTLLGFLNNYIIPTIVALATLFVVWNFFRYFILESGSEDGRTKARQAAIYGIAALVFIVAFWGIIFVFTTTFDLVDDTAPVPDYACSKFWGDCGTATP